MSAHARALSILISHLGIAYSVECFACCSPVIALVFCFGSAAGAEGREPEWRKGVDGGQPVAHELSM